MVAGLRPARNQPPCWRSVTASSNPESWIETAVHSPVVPLTASSTASKSAVTAPMAITPNATFSASSATVPSIA